MSNFAVAEWILSLVMPQQHAAAVVGDLAESAAGPVELWFAVLRAFFGSLFQQLLTPAEMATVARDTAVLALSLSVRYAASLLAPVVVLYLIIDAVPRLAALGALAGLFGALLTIAITLVVPWKMGRMMAERHPGRELPAFVGICVAVLAFTATAEAFGAPWNSILRDQPWVLLGWHQIPVPWNPVVILLSMILTRRRSFRRSEATPV
jgi:hypothetical protein